MEACLADPQQGYYQTQDPLGAQGDFITAPEISQIFGELIGLWAAEVWPLMGAPRPCSLIELGPGRGTLMCDALRALRIVPDFLEASDIHLVETSKSLRDIQKANLSDYTHKLHWHDRLDNVPTGSAIIIANEFFDALPIRQFVRVSNAWHERGIDLSPNNTFTFVPINSALEDPKDSALIPKDYADVEDGTILEVCPGTTQILATLGARAKEAPTAALIIDYGHTKSGTGDTLQAVRSHRFVEPLDSPGEADLTAHVDFARLTQDASEYGLTVYGPMSQEQFLLSLGLAQRCEKLCAHAKPDQTSLIASGAERLVDPKQMGELFKVIVVTGSGLPAPPPFN